MSPWLSIYFGGAVVTGTFAAETIAFINQNCSDDDDRVPPFGIIFWPIFCALVWPIIIAIIADELAS